MHIYDCPACGQHTLAWVQTSRSMLCHNTSCCAYIDPPNEDMARRFSSGTITQEWFNQQHPQTGREDLRLYTCCRQCDCRTFCDALNFFRKWGIEPAFAKDATGDYFLYTIPDYWNDQERDQFEEDLCDRITLVRCDICDKPRIGGMVLDHACGAVTHYCSSCMQKYIPAPCKGCGAMLV